MSLRNALRNLGLCAVVCAGVIAPAQLALAQEDNQRCEGTIVDDQGAPLADVKVTFL